VTTGSFAAPDGCRLAFADEGEGMPVLWQHGLGADRGQPAEVFPALPGLRRITLECRGHGGSDTGDIDRLTIEQFTNDAIGLLDHLGLSRAAIGGISLGAAVALRIAALHPDRAAALILARPAWVDTAAPAHLRVYREVADLIAAHGVEGGRARFEASPLLAEIEAVSPDNAASMRWFFDRPRPDSTVALLGRIPLDGPGVARERIAALALPTLVIANDHDYVHSLATARELAALIPGAACREITSKSVDRARYVAEFRDAVADFLEGVGHPDAG
jgi:pimeloyl-ACP methyl ester carboxylesterase